MSRAFIRERLTMVGLAVGALVIAARVGAAQTDPDHQSAYRALIYTPVAGLPPLPPNADSLGNKSGISLIGRLGHMTRNGGLSLTSYGVGVEVPKGRTRLGATIAYMSASCGWEWEGSTDCAGDIMLGGNMRTWITTRPLNGSEPPQKGKRSASNESKLLVGFEGSAGYSPRQGRSALAVAAELPTALALQSGTVRIMPFITPGIGYGRLGNVSYSDDEPLTSHGAIVPMIGGGLGLEFGTSGVGANVGFQRVLKGEGGTKQLGIGMTWNGLTAAR